MVLLQVADNGKGVPQEDHAALALKYHTSKISQFQDLEVTAAPAAALAQSCRLYQACCLGHTKGGPMHQRG